MCKVKYIYIILSTVSLNVIGLKLDGQESSVSYVNIYVTYVYLMYPFASVWTSKVAKFASKISIKNKFCHLILFYLRPLYLIFSWKHRSSFGFHIWIYSTLELASDITFYIFIHLLICNSFPLFLSIYPQSSQNG